MLYCRKSSWITRSLDTFDTCSPPEFDHAGTHGSIATSTSAVQGIFMGVEHVDDRV